MKTGCCHLCGGRLYTDPIVELQRMPKAAQYYPEVEEFATDHGITLTVYQCQDCSLVQLNAKPVDYYKEVITAATFSEKARLSRLEQMQKFVTDHDLVGKKILEVGCGGGGMLDVIAEAGMEPTGIEAGVNSVETGREFGRNMICDYIGEVDKVEGAPFAGFVSLNYLEHLPSPGEIIKKIHDNTIESAVGFVTVPNLEYLLKSKCFYEFVPDHLSYFTQKTITHVFQSNGFEVLECRTINNDNDILCVVKKRSRLDIAGQYVEVEQLIVDLKEIGVKYKSQGKRLAVWGAGHRTLALLALAKLDEIEFVVDSAKFKQGRYTPVLHKKIVSPEELKKSGIDLIMVMLPGLYPGEVLKIVEAMEIDIEVATLQGNSVKFL
jgi:2-polyprenyl-3-methyl-5-hydroxy-6-metoxy-1,4-benzoquinol methylase